MAPDGISALSASSPAPLLHSPSVPTPDSLHTVQFYDDAPFLFEQLLGTVGAALAGGKTFVALAAPEHLSWLADGLAARGFDLERITAQGRYAACDANELLGQFMVDDQVAADRFFTVVGGIIDQAAASAVSAPGPEPRVAVFGELVALLCASGRPDAAITLEHLWNDLAASRDFSLICAYPMTAFAQPEDAEALATICAAHHHVIPAESYTTLPDDAARAMDIVAMQQKAAALDVASRERERAHQALLQRKTELKDFIERVPVALHQIDADGIIVWANQAEPALLGYNLEEYVGRRVADVHVDPSVSEGILERLRRGEAVQDQPARLWCKDGSVRQVLISSMPASDSNLFNCVTLDMTVQQIATETTARLAAIVDSSDDAIVGKLLDGTVTSWNRAAEQLFGWRAEEMVGSSISRIVPPERRDDLASILARLGRGEKIDHHETVRMRADGRRIEVSVSISPIYDQQGTIIGVAKIARDISERRAAERRRQELLEVVAHDLRTPLTTVLGYAQLLQRRLGDDVALKAIATQASRMGRLLADVLETARLEAGRQHLRRAPFDLGELARESALHGDALLDSAGVRVVLPPEPIIGEWDSDRVSQILDNLLDNARKYAPNSETVIEVSRVGDEAWLAVRDQGPGIALADRGRVFERFYQGGSGEKPAAGVGLGLFISRALAEMHGGRLWVESEPGQGSVFTLALPLTPAATLDGDDAASTVPEQTSQPLGANAAR